MKTSSSGKFLSAPFRCFSPKKFQKYYAYSLSSEIETARQLNKNKRVEKRLRVLSLRAEGKNLAEIAQATKFSRSNVNRLIANYFQKGLSAVIDNHYTGNRRNMSFAEEAALLDAFRQRAEAGEVIKTKELSLPIAKARGFLVQRPSPTAAGLT